MENQQAKRGRPRSSFAATGEIDLSLITEFRARPILYDRDSKRHKDKPYLKQQWEMISHKLGYDVSVLKDRMLQLRNRFNIEKRRLDHLRLLSKDSTVKSTWPLYEELSFLADHIRWRRPFAQSEGSPNEDDPDEEADKSSSTVPEIKVEGTDADEGNPVTTVTEVPLRNTHYSRKRSMHVLRPHSKRLAEKRSAGMMTSYRVSDDENDEDDDDDVDVDEEGASRKSSEDTSPKSQPPNITIRCINGKHFASTAPPAHKSKNDKSNRTISSTNETTTVVCCPHSQIANNATASENNDENKECKDGYIFLSPTRKRPLSTDKRSEKYRAFGEFVGASLIDLGRKKALSLIGKFTNELVQSMMDEA